MYWVNIQRCKEKRIYTLVTTMQNKNTITYEKTIK